MSAGICRFFLMAALLSLLFTGCSAKQTERGQADGSLPGEDWNVQFVEMEPGSDGKLLGFAMTENGLYATFTRVAEDAKEYPLYYLSNEKLGQIKPKQTFETMPIEMPGDHQPLCLFSDGKEKLYILVLSDTGEEVSYILYGGDARYADITAAWKEAFDGESGSALAAADKDGFVYVGRKGAECKILVAREDGSLVYILEQPDYKLYDLTSVEGRIYCVGRSGETDVLFRADIQKQELETVANLPDSRGTVILRPGQGNYILYGYYDALYQYDLDKGEGRDIYAWTYAGIEGRRIEDFFMDVQGKLWVLPDLKEDNLEMLLQKPAAASESEPAVEKETGRSQI